MAQEVEHSRSGMHVEIGWVDGAIDQGQGNIEVAVQVWEAFDDAGIPVSEFEIPEALGDQAPTMQCVGQGVQQGCIFRLDRRKIIIAQQPVDHQEAIGFK